MGRVRVLPSDVVALISAGEVIDNPASIVKELVENSLDAGATHIDISISNGGIDQIVVADNGCGILKEDLPICIERHSTSKIATRSDIDAIATYGFRGEALASIAAVANLIITTRAREEQTGSRLVSRPGGEVSVSEASRPPGTTVDVTELFALFPARRKHLAEPKTEAQRIVDVVIAHAVVRNDIGFRLSRDRTTIIECPAGQSPVDRVVSLWGSDIARSLVEIDGERSGVRVKGFAVRPNITRGNRSRMLFSVLRRPICDERMSSAVEAAYENLLMRGRHPLCCIDVTVDKRSVDPNVHPTKKEIRLQDIDLVTQLIYESVNRAITKETPYEPAGTLEDFLHQSDETPSHYPHHRPAPGPARRTPTWPLVEKTVLETPPPSPDEATMNIPNLGGLFRIIGQMNNVYLLLEFEDGLVIVDQHAAHERVMYERLRRQVNEGKAYSQELLEPIVLRLDPRDVEDVLLLTDQLDIVGFSISSFGGNEILVSSVPAVLGRQVSEKEIVSLVDDILSTGTDHAREHFMDEIVKVTACHSAIRAGQPLSIGEVRALLEDMAKTPDRYNCPHGRPTLIKVTQEELDMRFKRLL
ncbi:MAG: DNA mismatch repair endonuclease MutL [Candidatus Thorarchaeota archaeon]|nr:DNA mismatch repair endonuclease MutL [Candidatus Thorarchaeota archaeon]